MSINGTITEEQEKRLRRLNGRALDIEEQIKTSDIPVVNGKLDLTKRDKRLRGLRRVNLEIAAILMNKFYGSEGAGS